MGQFVPKTFETILQRMIDALVARSELSDLTDTSIAKSFMAAFARELDDAYYQTKNVIDLFSIDRAAGEDLDERAKDYNPVVVTRIASSAATGNLQFSRAVAGPLVSIPAGVRVAVPGSSPEVIAVTTAAGSIPNLALISGLIPAVIESAGSNGNVAAATLTKFKGLRPTGVDTASNPSGFVGGKDAETDDSFRSRIRDTVAGLSRCTPSSIETKLKTIELPSGQRVVFVKVLEDPINLGWFYVYLDDGTGTAESTLATVSPELLTSGPEFPGDVALGGERYLYTNNFPIKDAVTPSAVKNPGAVTLTRVTSGPVAGQYSLNPASGQIYLGFPLVAGDTVTIAYTYFTGLLQEAQKVLDGDPLDRGNYPGWRAAGTLGIVRVPTIYPVVIVADITVLDGYSQATVAADVKAALASYVNGLGIGNNVIKSELIERAMAVEGMFDIQITAPAANLVVLDDQIPRTNESVDITIT
jgi:uncharacterized phage protein gp47/JayE